MRTIESFKNGGCWARVIRKPEGEINILSIREGQESSKLIGHDYPQTPGYTPYSSVTYVREGINTSLFMWNEETDAAFALLIRPTDRPIDWWYNCRDEVIANDTSAIPGKKYDNGKPDQDQRWNCNIQEIESAVLSLRAEQKAKRSKHDPDTPVLMRWNRPLA